MNGSISLSRVSTLCRQPLPSSQSIPSHLTLVQPCCFSFFRHAHGPLFPPFKPTLPSLDFALRNTTLHLPTHIPFLLASFLLLPSIRRLAFHPPLYQQPNSASPRFELCTSPSQPYGRFTEIAKLLRQFPGPYWFSTLPTRQTPLARSLSQPLHTIRNSGTRCSL